MLATLRVTATMRIIHPVRVRHIMKQSPMRPLHWLRSNNTDLNLSNCWRFHCYGVACQYISLNNIVVHRRIFSNVFALRPDHNPDIDTLMIETRGFSCLSNNTYSLTKEV
jgi:hypothetical protein